MAKSSFRAVLCAFAFIFFAVFCHAQEPLPDAPIPASMITSRMTPQVRPVMATNTAKSTRVVDTKFVVASVTLMALTIADLEKTQHCLANHSCVEMNPMLPHSRAGMYAVNLPINAATMYLAYRMKSQGRRTWWILPGLNAAGHLVGTAFQF